MGAVDRKLVATRQPEPRTMDPGQLPQPVVFFPDPPFEEVVQIAEPPRHQPEPSDAEQGVQDLGVDFDPYSAGAVDVVAVFFAVRAWWVAHELLAAADEEEEEHAAPSDDVEAVYHDEKTDRGEGEFPEAFEADERAFAPGVFGREFVAVWIDSIGIRAGGDELWGSG